MTVDTQVTWLTQEAYDRLKHELDELIANRPVIAAEINARREEGDLKENGGYHAAREEQGKQEARIRQLQELLRTAQVGDAPTASDTASPRHGGHDPLRRRRRRHRDVPARLARGGRRTATCRSYSPKSPLGAAILGARVGETREYRLPDGGRHEGHPGVRRAVRRLSPLAGPEERAAQGLDEFTGAMRPWPAARSASTRSASAPVRASPG